MPFFTKSVGDNKKELQVRASLALLFGIATVVGFFMNLVSQDAFMSLSIMSISYYFAKRNTEDVTKPNSPAVPFDR